MLLAVLLAAGGCSTYKQGIEIKGIGVPMESLLLAQESSHPSVLLDESNILQRVIDQDLDYGYVRVEPAIDQYVKGAPIVALSAAQDPNKQIWVLVTHKHRVRTQADDVHLFVRQFMEETKKRGWTPVQWDEREIAKAIGIKEHVNLSWFMDPYFVGGELVGRLKR